MNIIRKSGLKTTSKDFVKEGFRTNWSWSQSSSTGSLLKTSWLSLKIKKKTILLSIHYKTFKPIFENS
jgi:hypothetical protein